MTKLQELKAAYAAARDAAWDAYQAELRKAQEENRMTKLEELKAAHDAAYDAAHDAYAAAQDAYDAADTAWDAAIFAWADYQAERDKIQEENSND